ncbi:MAG: L-amino acid dehydrogenase [Phycisphaerae bacterium]|nr:L-amino acid dehydrogenase [Phycisphaerae bacterium]
MARTPLFSRLQQLFRLSRQLRQPSAPSISELLEVQRQRRWSRRQVLHQGVASAALLSAGWLSRGCINPRQSAPNLGSARVVIVGAGMAGLAAAHELQKAGISATLYDAAPRSGGRIYTANNIMAEGLTTELGGEFIDTGHTAMLELAAELGLELIDTTLDDATLMRESYYFGNTAYSEAEVVAALGPLAEQMSADYDTTGEIVDYQNEGNATALDQLSISEYLDQLGATGFIRSLLEVAYVTEYGLNADEQSALNLLFLIGLDTSENRFEVFGESDERYKIRGGNQQIVDQLAARLTEQIHLEHALLAINDLGSSYRLSFASGSQTVEVNADVLILALPFTRLRQVEFNVDMPEVKRRVIDDLGYGTNAKLMIGFNQRLWRELGSSGNIFSDEAFQLAWDNSRQQNGNAGGLTLYSGGTSGVTVGNGTPAEQADLLLPGLEKAFPGLTAQRNSTVERFHWPTYIWTLGSYACYRPGQWTTIAGAESLTVGNIYFAGEHCSYDYQGYMNGAADTGLNVARTILDQAGLSVRRRQQLELPTFTV